MLLEYGKGIRSLSEEDLYTYVNDCLSYDKITGIIRWKSSRPSYHYQSERAYKIWRGHHAGNVAGGVHSLGHLCIGLNGRSYKSHRIAFLLETKKWPRAFVDHINGDKVDNRWCNLRDVTSSVNGKNKKKRADNKSGVTGVYFRKDTESYVVQGVRDIGGESKAFQISTHETLEEASLARKAWERSVGVYTERHGK